MRAEQKELIDLNKWCRYIVYVGHATAALIILAHVVWYFAARSILACPPDVYLRNYIIFPAIGFMLLNSLVGVCVGSARFPVTAKAYLSLSLFVIFSLYLSLTHNIARVLLCSYILPIFASTIFSSVKLTRRIFLMSAAAVLLPGVKMYSEGKFDGNMLMEIFASYFMFICAYLLSKVLIRFGSCNLTALTDSHEEAANNEFAFLQAQIRPHFIYNAINTIESFCYTDSEKAADLLVDFSKYLRLTFDVDRESILVPLAREIELIKAYAEIEKARFGELIDVRYDIDPELMNMKIPSFCIQPLVENAIKHGLCKKSSGGTVVVSARKDEGVIIIKVSDNGVGMPAEKLGKLRNVESENGGVGFFNVVRRLKGWKDARINIESAENEGTEVTITISAGKA